MVYFSGKEEKKKEQALLFEMARPALLKLMESQLVNLGKASQASGLIGSVERRLSLTKLKDRKNILEVLRGLVESKVEEGYLQDMWDGKYESENNSWRSITSVLLEGFESTDNAVQYENAKTLQALVKSIVGGGYLPLIDVGSIVPK